jgi:hypothetical protein
MSPVHAPPTGTSQKWTLESQIGALAAVAAMNPYYTLRDVLVNVCPDSERTRPVDDQISQSPRNHLSGRIILSLQRKNSNEEDMPKLQHTTTVCTRN